MRNWKRAFVISIGVTLSVYVMLTLNVIHWPAPASTSVPRGMNANTTMVRFLTGIPKEKQEYGPHDTNPRPVTTGPLAGVQEREQASVSLDINSKSTIRLLAGVPRTERVYLTMGMVTVKRDKGDYFFDTLASLLQHSSPEDRKEMTIVVMLADRDPSWNEHMLGQIKTRYPSELQTGLLLVISAPNTEFLFHDSDIKRTFGDSLMRVQWRSKQNLDYAAVMEFCMNRSSIYLNLEDDVLTVDGYLPQTRDFIKANERKLWAMLEVSPEGNSRGKLFKNEDLPKLVMILRSFYLEQPGDWLMGYFRNMMTQKNPIVRPRSLFFHRGKFSSLKDVIREPDKMPESAKRNA